jgi:uncharacterized protein (DUF362 family)
MRKKISRRLFLKTGSVLGIQAMLNRPLRAKFWKNDSSVDLAVVKGTDCLRMVGEAVTLLGGIERFVPHGAGVALLPNPGSSNPGTYTKPEILRAVIQLCREAGASKIACITWLTMGDWIACGLKKVIDEEGVDLDITDLRDESQFKPVMVSKGVHIKEVRILNTFYDYDVLIGLPIAKEHSGNKYSGALKSMMGLNSPKSCRKFHHKDWIFNSEDIEYLEQCIADLNTVVRSDLCITDATEFVITNGPYGPGELSRPQKIIAGTDHVAVDAYCARFFGLKPADVFAVKQAYKLGVGEMDLTRLNIREIVI